MMLTGCGVKDADGSVNETNSAGEEVVSGELNAGDKGDFAGRDGIKAPEEKQYTWLEYTIVLPDDWIGRCVIEENEDGFSIYQKASYEKDDTLGYICGFFRTQEPVEYDDGMTIIACTEDGTLYYMVQPTDVSL